MPQSLAIGAFVLGAVLLLISLLSGGFKIFGAEVSGTTGITGRVVAFVIGVILLIIGFSYKESEDGKPSPLPQPPSVNTPFQPRNLQPPSTASTIQPSTPSVGFPPGYGMQICGCWGFNPPLTAPEQRCQSGYVRLNSCPGFCPTGGIPYAYVCQ